MMGAKARKQRAAQKAWDAGEADRDASIEALAAAAARAAAELAAEPADDAQPAIDPDLDAVEPATGSSSGRVDRVVAEEETGQRLDKWLATALPDLSRSRLKALVVAGDVSRVDAVRSDVAIVITDPAHAVRHGDTWRVEIPEPEAAEPVAQDIALVIAHEDAHLIVIDKPAGLVVHPAAGHASGTLVNALLFHCGDQLSGIGGVRRPGIVHRLDKDTSGLLVVAKDDRTHQGLSRQFADHGRTGPLERVYTALVWGEPTLRSGTVDAPIDRHPQDRNRMAVCRAGQGREAVTHYTVEKIWTAPDGSALVSRIACALETGRTHQIRVHMAHLGHPLLGDATYGAGFRTKAARLGATARAMLDAMDRQALHAGVLGFEHPMSRETLRFESALPADLQGLVDALDTCS